MEFDKDGCKVNDARGVVVAQARKDKNLYSNLPFYKMKWSVFLIFLPKLYSKIICKNIVKIFQKFEVRYIQTCTSFKSNTMLLETT